MLKKLFNKLSKKSKRLAHVAINLSDHEGKSYQIWIEIPDGCTFTNRYADHPTLWDKDGTVIKQYDLRAGFTATFNYEYEEK